MTPDEHNKAVKATYPVGAHIGIDSRAHSPFPILAEVTGYDYAPTGRILLRLKHIGPRHWNQPKEFVFDPEMETVAKQDVASYPLTELERHNLAILRAFRLYDNVTVRHAQLGQMGAMRLGHVVGFVYDDHGKLFIRVQYLEHFSKEPEHALVNPNSKTTLVTNID